MTKQQKEVRFDLHATRYGEIVSADLPQEYTEAQCGECPHEHRCCDMIVMSTPAEAAGILQWLSKNYPDVMGITRAVGFRASILGDHFKKFAGDQANAIGTWYGKRLKCVFYDKEKKRCSIYPVRPAVCRRSFGAGDCEAYGTYPPTGVKIIPEDAQVLTARVARFKIHPDLNNNLAELTSLVATLANYTGEMQVDQEFFNKDPATLTDDQIMYGLAGAPIPNPVALKEDQDGSPISPGDPGN